MPAADFLTICQHDSILNLPSPGIPHQSQDVHQAKILIVDDESLNIDVVRGYLELDGYHNIETTEQAVHALPLLGTFRPDLVLLDIHMPVLSGLEILKAIRRDEVYCAIPVVILTASSTNDTKLEALEGGATDLLSKPVHRGELLARIRNVLTAKAYQDRLCRYSEELEIAVRNRTADLEASRLEVIHCLARAAEFRDDDTGQHIIRVGRYARIIGEELGLSKSQLELLEPAAQLHDVGKIGISDSILLKPGKPALRTTPCREGRGCVFRERGAGVGWSPGRRGVRRPMFGLFFLVSAQTLTHGTGGTGSGAVMA